MNDFVTLSLLMLGWLCIDVYAYGQLFITFKNHTHIRVSPYKLRYNVLYHVYGMLFMQTVKFFQSTEIMHERLVVGLCNLRIYSRSIRTCMLV